MLATVGGLWRSLDSAKTWERVSDLDGMLAGAFSAVVYNPVDSKEVFAAAGDANRETLESGSRWGVGWHSGGPGLWRSDSSGASGSWTHIVANLQDNLTLDDVIVHRLVMSNHLPWDLYLATNHGVYVGQRAPSSPDSIHWSNLGGRTWPCSDLVLDESSSPSVVYAGVFRVARQKASQQEGIWRYDSEGWSIAFSPSDSARGGVIALGVSRSMPTKPKPVKLYAAIEDIRSRDPRWTGADLGTVVQSEDGKKWTPVRGWSDIDDTTHYGGYNSRLLVDPDSADVFYVAGQHLFRCEHDAGCREISDDWYSPDRGRVPRGKLHDDQHCMAIGRFRGSRCLYAGNDGGLDRLVLPDDQPMEVDWYSCDHGLDITEFYDVAVQQVTPMAIIGGTQDNGAPVTFGNKSWLAVANHDAARVAFDAPTSSMLYEGCIDPSPSVLAFAHPIPSVNRTLRMLGPATVVACPPLAAHPFRPGAAIAAGRDLIGHEVGTVMKLDSTGVWHEVRAKLPAGAHVECVAMSGRYPNDTCYVGFTVGRRGEVWSSTDGGKTWPSGRRHVFPGILPTRIVVDKRDAAHAYASFGGRAGGEVYVTTDAGDPWQRLTPSIALDSLSIQGLAISADDPNEIFAAIEVGVLKGTVTLGPSPHVRWEPFDTGLPNGVDVTSLAVNVVTSHLIAGTMGYGVYECAIGRGTSYADRVLVRDNVFDRGDEPSPINQPNPEDPIFDRRRMAQRADSETVYKYNDTPGGMLNWWSSEDVRISERGANSPPESWIVDPVSVESCPIAGVNAGKCPPGEICDVAPKPGSTAQVFIQVHNAGIRTAHHVRVLGLWAPPAQSAPPLPDSVWTTTFQAHAATCGPLPEKSNWHFLSSKTCSTSFSIVPEIAPDESRIVTFPWDVPEEAGPDPSILAIVESDEDSLPDTVRTRPIVNCPELVPDHHQVALRSLHHMGLSVDPNSGLALFELQNTTRQPWTPRLLISAAGNPVREKVVVIPDKRALVTSHPGFTVFPFALNGVHFGLNWNSLNADSAEYLVAPSGTIDLRELKPGARVQLAVAIPVDRPPFPWRFTITAMRDSTVLGGNTYLVSGPP